MTKSGPTVGIRETTGLEHREGTRPDSAGGGPRRVAVFVDYWWVYNSARQLFGGVQPPAWFGNVAPVELGRMLVKRPPASVRRSERVAAGVHVFIRGYDPAVHHGQHERVQRWTAAGATVDVGPAREAGGGFWQSSVSVALASAVTEALATGACDTAVVFAGDVALLPLLTRLAGTDAVSPRLELATWVGKDGTVPTQLASVTGIWCHRLGEQSFRQASDDRRPTRPGGARLRRPDAAAQPHKRQGHGPHRPPPVSTAMAAAFAAAGLSGASQEGVRPQATEPARPAAAASEGAAPSPPPQPYRTPDAGGVMRRLTQRLFGRGA